MKLLNKLKKQIKASVIIYSLLNTSLLSLSGLQAQVISKPSSNKESSGITSNDVLQVMSAATDTYSKYIDFKSTSIMQQIQAQKNQEMMQSLSPSCRKADGTSCFTVRGKFFPECPLPASMSNTPQNVCSSASPLPAQISSMITYESISKNWVNYYDQMLNEASNMSVPFGLKCLQDKQKAMDSQLSEMVNNLTRLQDQLNKDKEVFKANNKKLLEEMTSTFDELNGSTGKNNLNAKAIDFSKYFSPSCQSVIGDQALSAGKELGLLGLRQALIPVNKRAADFNSNRTILENEMRADVEKMQKSINEGGLSDYLTNMDKQKYPSKFRSLGVAADKKSDEFKTSLSRINSELREIGYEVPKMGKGFSVDFDKFLASSQSFFKKKYINDCVSGADQSGVALTTDQILGAIQQKTTKNKGNARDKYKVALAAVLKQDVSAEKKLELIKELEETYKDMSVTYNNNSAEKVTETPYDLYMRTLEKCNQKFTQDESFATGNQKGLSQQTKIARGQELLREIKGLHDNYASSLGADALNQALSCNGEAKKSGANCSGPEAFDHTKDSFCINHASSCANEVNGCFAEAEKHVEVRKTKMDNLAKTYNNNVTALIARSNALYNQQKAGVMDMIKNVQAHFPGTNFLIPEGMFISMPEMKMDTFGVSMANDGNLAFMEELPKKIDLLKDVFKVQQTKVKDEISDYIGKQTAAMNKERAKWEALAGECKSMIDTSSKELAKMNSEGQKKQDDLNRKVAKFCEKYSELKESPVPACDAAKSLAEDVSAIANNLSTEAITLTRKYRSVCNGYNNEKDIEIGEEEDCSDPIYKDLKDRKKCKEDNDKLKQRLAAKGQKSQPPMQLKSVCPSDSTSESEFIANVAGNFPDDKEEILKYKTISEAFANKNKFDDRGFFESIQEALEFKSNGSEKGVCAKLKEISSLDGASTEKPKEKIEKLESEISEYPSKIRKAEQAIRTAEEDLNDLQENLKTAKPEAIVDLNRKIERAKKSLGEAKLEPANLKEEKEEKEKKLAELKVKKDNGPYKESLKFALSALRKPLLSGKEQYAQEIQRIGQQTTANCDVRSTTGMPKTFSTPSLLPPGFDTGALTR